MSTSNQMFCQDRRCGTPAYAQVAQQVLGLRAPQAASRLITKDTPLPESRLRDMWTTTVTRPPAASATNWFQPCTPVSGVLTAPMPCAKQSRVIEAVTVFAKYSPQ